LRRLHLYILCFASFVTYFSGHLITPLVPVLAGRLGAEELGVAAASGIHILFLSLFQILAGAVADRYGRRRCVALGSILAASTSLLCITARSWGHLAALRALGGVADAVVGPALLALVVEASGDERGLGMGLFRGSQGLALVLGPIAGGVLAHYLSLYTPFLLDFLLTLLGASLFLMLPIGEAPRAGRLTTPIRRLGLLLRDLRLLKAAAVGFSETFSLGVLMSLLPALAVGLGLSEVEIASLLAVEAALFSASSLLSGPASDRVGRRPIAALGLLICLTAFPAFSKASQLPHLLTLTALYGLGSSMIYLMSSTMAADLLPGEGRAALFGAFDALMDLGLILGPALCYGLLALGFGVRHLFLILSAPFIPALLLLASMAETRWSEGSHSK